MGTSQSDISTRVMLTSFALLAEIERDLIRERTKVALAAWKAAVVRLGRPAGSSKLGRHGGVIRHFVGLGATQKRLAKQFDCTPQTMCKWLKRKRPRWKKEGRV